jgi:pimeloyl-ACP methyl ester carboxylesterase
MTSMEGIADARPLALTEGTILYRDTGSGPPVVFVNGLLTNSLVWCKLVLRLKSELRCVTPDLPLGGHSVPMPPDADLSPHGLARMVAELIERLELERPTVVGITAGGVICQVLAIERPDVVGRLVLLPVEAYDNVPPEQMRPLSWSARVPGMTFALMQTTRIRSSLRSPRAWGWTAKRMWEPELFDAFLGSVQSNPRVARDMAKVLRGLRPEVTLSAAEHLNRFDRPVLIIWPPEDRLMPFEHAQRLARTFPNARLEPLEDSYTYVVQDQPERVADLLREFVLGPPGPGARDHARELGAAPDLDRTRAPR